ncbi:hypothetical protein BFW38_13455 [Terasakiispira papahanaumokuakeensis]|uniref:DUF6916 domain-containing protein n=1 Tax=Terasakiispira papahanaumokuakeensis TaxID=197479 RepID=A0A1E2VBL2_9GAMM|nr:hypothetical protein [Terasakiispira papahanaumokuakeensis]ODC04387.1 hypothetical protein BFW38_13455 [Terasakiispira papahanaumokuakeensis]
MINKDVITADKMTPETLTEGMVLKVAHWSVELSLHVDEVLRYPTDGRPASWRAPFSMILSAHLEDPVLPTATYEFHDGENQRYQFEVKRITDLRDDGYLSYEALFN